MYLLNLAPDLSLFEVLKFFSNQDYSYVHSGVMGGPLGITDSKCQFYPPDMPYKIKFLLLKVEKSVCYHFRSLSS